MTARVGRSASKIPARFVTMTHSASKATSVFRVVVHWVTAAHAKIARQASYAPTIDVLPAKKTPSVGATRFACRVFVLRGIVAAQLIVTPVRSAKVTHVPIVPTIANVQWVRSA